MEGTPFAVENNNDDKEEERKAKIKKPENLGILAVESPDEPKQSPLEKVIAALREPAPEAEKKPSAEEEPVVLPEVEPPVERVPEEDTRRVVHEEEEEPPAPAAEVEPVETPEAEPPKPEAEPAPVVEIEPETTKPEAAEEPPEIPEETPAVRVMAEKAPEPAAEVEPEAEPETPPDEDDKKPGFIRSLFKRREREKPEPEPEPETEQPEPEAERPEPETEAEPASEPEIEKPAPEEPEFRFNEQTEKPAEKLKVEKVPEEIEASPKPEAKPEQIGQMLLQVEDVSVEKPPQPIAEAAVSSQAAEERMNVEASPIEPVSGKRIDTLSRGELMDLAATINVDGSNLRHIYETHLIGERGLRRLVAEHVRGGDLQKALRHEVLKHEMDFERDPHMRDAAPQAAAPLDGNNAVLDKLLQEAGASMSGAGEQTAFSKASAPYKSAGARQSQSRQYRVLDIALVATISILTLLVILVLLFRG